MTHPAVNQEQVATLFAERERYESWLKALEARRASTPPHIYTRVHADYTARLQRVIEQLGSHRAVLQEIESTLMDRLTSLDIDDAKLRDEVAEAELRATVGELPPGQHTEIVTRTERELATLSGERTRVQGELAQLRQMLELSASLRGGASASDAAAAAPPSPPARPAPAGTQDWELAFEAPPPVSPSARPAGGRASGQTIARTSGARRAESEGSEFDDLAFLKSLRDPSRVSGEHGAVGNGGAPGGESSSTASASASPAIPAPASPPAPAAAAIEQTVSAPAASAASPAPAPIPTVPAQTPESEPLVTHPAHDTGLPLILPDGTETRGSGKMPAYLKDTPPEQVKTLKCQECGTLNYPTEWYCERCGAELAAL